MATVNIAALIASVFIILATFYSKYNKTGLMTDLKEDSRQFDILLKTIQEHKRLIWWVVFLLAVFFRIWKLGIIPAGLNQDSAMSAVEAQAILKYGTDRFGMQYPVHFTAWLDSQQSPMLIYLMVPVFALFGVSHMTMVIPAAAVSIAGMLAFYLLVKEIMGDLPALLAFFIVSFNPWHFVQSRWALDANMFPHFLMVALLLLMKGIHKTKYIYAAMIFFGLSHYCYGISLYTVPVFLLLYCLYLVKNKLISGKTVFISIIIYVGLSLPFFLTMIITASGLPEIQTPLFTIPSFSESTRGGDIVFFSPTPWRDLLDNAVSLFSTVIMQKTGTLWNTVPTFGSIYRCMIPFSLLGIYQLARLCFSSKTASALKAGCVGMAIFGGVAFGSGFVTVQPNTWRINIFHYMHIFLVLLGICFIGQISKRAYRPILLLLTGMNILFVITYFTSFAQAWKEGDSYSYHFKNALVYTAELDCDVYYITNDTLYDGSAQVSEIDTIFLHGLDALYLQGKTNRSGERDYRPYHEQYRYIKASDLEQIDPAENAVYLINYYDQDLFSEADFQSENFGPYIVEIPKLD